MSLRIKTGGVAIARSALGVDVLKALDVTEQALREIEGWEAAKLGMEEVKYSELCQLVASSLALLSRASQMLGDDEWYVFMSVPKHEHDEPCPCGALLAFTLDPATVAQCGCTSTVPLDDMITSIVKGSAEEASA